eukprot:2013572-Prorocentrum_lima.AAC.1
MERTLCGTQKSTLGNGIDRLCEAFVQRIVAGDAGRERLLQQLPIGLLAQLRRVTQRALHKLHIGRFYGFAQEQDVGYEPFVQRHHARHGLGRFRG